MKYISTRGNAPELGFEEVIIAGLANDGGLYVPKNIPEFSKEEIKSWVGLTYEEVAFKVMKPFVGEDIPEKDLQDIINRSYSSFSVDVITPITILESGESILELFHGPTLAFKDIALQFLGQLLDYVLDKRDENVVIVGATSGDTGSAAIEGCRGCEHIDLFMLHPFGRVSGVQRMQMTTILSDNIYNIAVEGNFDDCQNMVKEMFAAENFAKNKNLVAVNSINWARIMAQIVYYFYSSLKVNGCEDPVSFSVPTGNFGDIFAGYMAKKMGLPIKKLIVATNKNDILDRFFKNNDYSKNGVAPTVSPSMDIQVSSNFERLLFDLYDMNGDVIAGLMKEFDKNGVLNVGNDVLKKARDIFDSHSTDDDAICQVITDVYSDSGYIVDPHTATGVAAARTCCSQDDNVMVLATASPAKFPEIIEKAIGVYPDLPSNLSNLMERKERYVRLPLDIEVIKSYITDNC